MPLLEKKKKKERQKKLQTFLVIRVSGIRNFSYTKFEKSVLYFIIRKFLITTNFSLQNFHVSYRGCSIHLNKIFMSITSDVAFLLFFCSFVYDSGTAHTLVRICC